MMNLNFISLFFILAVLSSAILSKLFSQSILPKDHLKKLAKDTKYIVYFAQCYDDFT